MKIIVLVLTLAFTFSLSGCDTSSFGSGMTKGQVQRQDEANKVIIQQYKDAEDRKAKAKLAKDKAYDNRWK